MSLDKEHMTLALNLALKGQRKTNPNPMVGCVIVHEGQVIGKGWHKGYGKEHAEINAINDVKKKYRDSSQELLTKSSMYVTLEPCSRQGNTPPCVNEIIKSGLQKVFIASSDNSQEGINNLRNQGIQVEIGILKKEARDINKGFFSRIEKGRPYTLAKIAIGLDGGIALKNGESKWITSKESREDVHILRSFSDAIMTGGNTIRRDDPSLTVRLDKQFKNPLRCIVSRNSNFSGRERIFNDGGKTTLYTSSNRKLTTNNKLQIHNESNNQGQDLVKVLNDLGSNHINYLLIECGASLLYELFSLKLIDELVIYQAPKVLGGNRVNFINLEGRNKQVGKIALELLSVENKGIDKKIILMPKY